MKTEKIIMLFLIMFQSCIGFNEPKRDEITGTWINEKDGSEIIFKRNGTFEGKNLSNNHFFISDSTDSKFDGIGGWSFNDGQTGWELDMFFKSTSNNHSGYKMPFYIEREGILNNGKILYLYLWVEEEGGERYKFNKKR